jgi:hypothetical protein
LRGNGIDIWRLQYGIARAPEMVVPLLVRDDKEKVRLVHQTVSGTNDGYHSTPSQRAVYGCALT